MAYAVNEYPSMCRECWREEWEGEARRVALQLERAKKAQGAATLSLKQWLATLDFCGWRCAFCDGPFEAMDHYVPLKYGGGTVWSNCLPICKRDNTRKGDIHPNDPAMRLIFSAAVIERISGSRHFSPPKSPLRRLLKGGKTGRRASGCARTSQGERKESKIGLVSSCFSTLTSKTSVQELLNTFYTRISR